MGTSPGLSHSTFEKLCSPQGIQGQFRNWTGSRERWAGLGEAGVGGEGPKDGGCGRQVQSRKIRRGCPSLGLQESMGTVQPQDEVTCLQLTCPICK